MNLFFRNAGAGLVLLALAGCAPRTPPSFQGYIEGEFVYVGAPVGGLLTNLAVQRGAEVRGGQLLYELEGGAEAAAVREAEDRLTQAGARLENLKKGRRPTELAALEAQLKSAQASLNLSSLEWDRQVKLMEAKTISPQEFDAARIRREVDQARVNSLAADLETARLGARVDEIKAAEADVKASGAALDRAQWSLAQKRQPSPTNAWVQDTLYREGEFVAVGQPVVTLLPPANIKVRFFIPQDQLPSVQRGRKVRVRMDGAAAPLSATVSYVSPTAEFTPPVIYSKENRSKLVFMVEAVFPPDQARNLKPGQPVDVSLEP
jgi:HlyD family secretion protein